MNQDIITMKDNIIKLNNKISNIYDKENDIHKRVIKEIEIYRCEIYLRNWNISFEEWMLKLNSIVQQGNNIHIWLKHKMNLGYVLIESHEIQEDMDVFCDKLSRGFCDKSSFNVPFEICKLISFQIRCKPAIFKAFSINKEGDKLLSQESPQIKWKTNHQGPVGQIVKDVRALCDIMREFY